MLIRLYVFVLMSVSICGALESGPCQPTPEIRSKMEQAGSRQIIDPADFDHNIAPYRALRESYPNDLFVHESYQDAVARYGIEGHLRAMVDEYNALTMQHKGEVLWVYLYTRSLMGRSTGSAIAGLTEILLVNPKFSPAHRTLAEIYGTEAFRNLQKEQTERATFEKQCPGGKLIRRPGPLPDSSVLLTQAEKLLAQNGSPEQAMEQALKGIQQDEWRQQRVRPFDWYSLEFKREELHKMRAEYWRLWALQVRCYRRQGDQAKTNELLALMEQRAAGDRRRFEQEYWDASMLLLKLYREGSQEESALRKVRELKAYLAEHPDSQRARQIDENTQQNGLGKALLFLK